MISLGSAQDVTLPDGILHIVRNPGLDEPRDLLGHEVCFNGYLARVTRVETFMIARPYPCWLFFGIMTEPLSSAGKTACRHCCHEITMLDNGHWADENGWYRCLKMVDHEPMPPGMAGSA